MSDKLKSSKSSLAKGAVRIFLPDSRNSSNLTLPFFRRKRLPVDLRPPDPHQPSSSSYPSSPILFGDPQASPGAAPVPSRSGIPAQSLAAADWSSGAEPSGGPPPSPLFGSCPPRDDQGRLASSKPIIRLENRRARWSSILVARGLAPFCSELLCRRVWPSGGSHPLRGSYWFGVGGI